MALPFSSFYEGAAINHEPSCGDTLYEYTDSLMTLAVVQLRG